MILEPFLAPSASPGAPPASPEIAAPVGRVLRVKFGHNPNSSGIGTSSFALLWGIGVAGLVLNTASAFVLAAWADARVGPPSSLPTPQHPDA